LIFQPSMTVVFWHCTGGSAKPGRCGDANCSSKLSVPECTASQSLTLNISTSLNTHPKFQLRRRTVLQSQRLREGGGGGGGGGGKGGGGGNKSYERSFSSPSSPLILRFLRKVSSMGFARRLGQTRRIITQPLHSYTLSGLTSITSFFG
jgi:hypothetical protein